MQPRRLSLFALLFMAWMLPAAAADTGLDPLVFDSLAGELASGLASKQSTIDSIRTMFGWTDAQPRRLAVIPFDRGEASPIPDDVARRFNDALLDALVSRKDLVATPVARQDLKPVMDDMANFGQKGQIKLLEGAGKVEIRVKGRVVRVDGGVELSYRAIAEDSTVLASARRMLAFDWQAASAIPLDQAIEKAAVDLAGRAKDIRQVAVAGILSQPGNGHSELGRYLANRLIDRMRTRVKELRTIGVWVSVTRLEEANLEIGEQPVERLAADTAGNYVLSGDMTPLSQWVEVVFKLRGSGGDVTHHARITRASLDPALLPPALGRDDPFADDNLGRNRLMLSSDHGGNPVYHIGDTVNLVIQSAEDGHLYCFVQQSRGGIVRIFPNRYHAATRIAGRRQVTVPGTTMPFDWTIEPPPGEDLVKCFVLDRDVWAELPKSITAQDFEPMPGIKALDDLRAIFHALRRVALSEATLRVTVAERR